MKLLCAKQFIFVGWLSIVLTMGLAKAEDNPGGPRSSVPTAAASSAFETQTPARAFPRVRLTPSVELTYIGMFSPDAIFRTPSKLAGATGYSAGEDVPPAKVDVGKTGVPESMLIPNERVVEDFEPPARATAKAQASSRAVETRDRALTYAYGRPSVLFAPDHVATDSQQRVILSDPRGNAVHVLDPRGKTSFRIPGGNGRRLQQPAGIAVDADDNIYVADAAKGMVLMFDRNGNFVRTLGDLKGEPEFARPDGIAIDRKSGRLYMVDTPSNMVFQLDLNGKVLKKCGRERNGLGVGQFDEPTEIAISQGRIFVLDGAGVRIQILDFDLNVVGGFELPHGFHRRINLEDGLGADLQGDIFVSSFHGAIIRMFSQAGRLLASFGQPGRRVGEFEGPDGLWVDASNRLYVADSGNGRVQLFQLSTLP
jgi:DNA-binding beta-propeller fold protein YncE